MTPFLSQEVATESCARVLKRLLILANDLRPQKSNAPTSPPPPPMRPSGGGPTGGGGGEGQGRLSGGNLQEDSGWAGAYNEGGCWGVAACT